MSPIFGATASQVLRWAPSGAYDAIASTTLSASAASITFSGIPSTYTHLQLRVLCGASTNASVNYKLNSDGTATNYYYHRLQGDGSSAASAAGNLNRILDYAGTSTYFYGAVIDILDYASISKNKTLRAIGGHDNNSNGLIGLYSNGWTNTAAVTTIDLYPDAGNFVTYSSFALYGIR